MLNLVTLIVAVVGIVVAIVINNYNNARQQKQFRDSINFQKRLAFPFDCYVGAALQDLKRKKLGPLADLPYLPRRPPGLQESLQSTLDRGNILLTGRAGLGKTREALESIERYARGLGDEVTVLVPRDNFDATFQVPTDIPLRHVVVFIDDVHLLFEDVTASTINDEAFLHDFEERLRATLARIRLRFGGTLRLVFTARDEPEFRERRRPDSSLWKEFAAHQLPYLHTSLRPSFVQAVANQLGIPVSRAVVETIASNSDGTCLGITTGLAQFQDKARIEANDIRGWRFASPGDWKTDVYERWIRPSPYRDAAFKSLAVLRRARLRPGKALVLELAMQLCPWPRLFAWWKVSRVIERELYAWVFEFQGEYICNNTYLDYIVEDVQGSSALCRSLCRLIRRGVLLPDALPAIGSIAAAVRSGALTVSDGDKVLRVAQVREPTSAEFWVDLANYYQHAGNLEEAKRSVLRAISADESLASAFFVLAHIECRLQDRDAELNAARCATQLAPDHAPSWLCYGIALTKKVRFDEAVTALQKAVSMQPNWATARIGLAIALDRAGNHERAATEGATAIELAPHTAAAWESYGISCEHLRNGPKAVEALERAYQLAPTSESIALSLSRAHVEFKNPDRALEILRRTMKSSPLSAKGFLTASICLERCGQRREAVDAARRALSLEADLVDAKRVLAVNLGYLADKAAQTESLTLFKALAEQEGDASDWASLGRAYGRAHDPQAAVDAARRALSLEADLVDAKRVLAVNLGYLADKAAQTESLTLFKALAEQEGDASDWASLGRAYGRAHDPQAAVDAARRALSLEADLVDAKRVLAVNLGYLADEAAQTESLTLFKALAEQEGDASDWAALAMAQGISRDAPAAVDSAIRSLQLDPLNERALVTLSMSLGDLPSNVKAQASVRIMESLELRPETIATRLAEAPEVGGLWRLAAWAYANSNRAKELVTLALQRLLECPDAHGTVVCVAEELRQRQASHAETLIKRIVEIEPNNFQYWNLYGAILRETKQWGEALQCHQRAIALNAKYGGSHYGLGRVYESMGDGVNARSAFRAAAAFGHRKAMAWLAGNPA